MTISALSGRPDRRERRWRGVGLVSVAAFVASVITPTSAAASPGDPEIALVPAVVGSQAEGDPTETVPSPGVSVPLPSAEPGPSDPDRVIGPGGRSVITGGVTDSSSEPVDGDPRRLQVKFTEASGVRSVGGRIDDGVDGSELDAALRAFSDLRFEPLFEQPAATLRAARRVDMQRSGTAVPDLAGWFVVEAVDAGEGRALLRALEDLHVVEMVQPEPALATTQLEAAEEIAQGYLDHAPTGIGAEWAWVQRGGTGAQVTVAVIDSGFDLSHADADRASAPGVAIGDEEPWESRHGLHVVGIIAADDDGEGLRGIAHDAGLRIINSGRSGSDVARAILRAADVLGPGDVITISQGLRQSDGVILPLVYSAAARDALRTAAARGIITLISAGNGGTNLDPYERQLGSDAPATIVVGGGNPGAAAGCSTGAGARSRASSSNYGERVDLQGWGACVRTASPGNGFIWWGFTSAATPVVAGAAALLSSMEQAQRGVALSGGQVRARFRSTGQPQVGAGNIGPLPDLRAAMGVAGEMPPNDMWGSARPVSELPSVLRVNNRFAGVQLDEPPPPCGRSGATVWYRIDAPRDLDVVIDTVGSDHDTVVAVWRVDERRLTAVGCNDDIGPRNDRSRVEVGLRGGATYYVQVGGRGRTSGDVVVRMWGDTFGATCDLDGDRRSELVVGSPDEELSGEARAGRAVVVAVGAGGRPDRTARVSQDSAGVGGNPERGDRFGAAVACGDFDGDGVDDLIVASPTEQLGRHKRAGAVHVLPGSRSRLIAPGGTLLTMDTPGILGNAFRGDRFGTAVAAGDFNGDGFDDLAIGVPGREVSGKRGAGMVVVIPGGGDGLDPSRTRVISASTRRIPGRARPDAGFGSALAADDVNFDGYDDLAIGSPGDLVAGARGAGSVILVWGAAGAPGSVHGSATRLDQRSLRVGTRPGLEHRFGTVVAFGLIDGDPTADLVVSAPGHRVDGARLGVVHAIPGGTRRLGVGRSWLVVGGADDTLVPRADGDEFGAALAVGDIDGDGLDDVVIGAPGTDADGVPDSGAAHVLFGSRVRPPAFDGGMVLAQDIAFIGGRGQPGDAAGAAVAVVDLDGDGRATVAVGIPGEDLARTDDGPRLADVGRLVLVRVGADRTVTSVATLTQRSLGVGADEPGDRFGSVLYS